MRRKSKPIHVGDVTVGGVSPISIQSMPRSDTRDINATVAQLHRMVDSGCDIARVAVPDMEAVKALGEIKKLVGIPIIADIHFSETLALEAIESADQIRFNPGNINSDSIDAIVLKAKERQIPLRIGINAGSLKHEPGENVGVKMVDEAMSQVDRLESMGFSLIEISLKSSDVRTTIEANIALAGLMEYPIHIGITEAGPMFRGSVKSSIGIGSLLLRGIGDSLRVSLTMEEPEGEIWTAREILTSLHMRPGPRLISCPTCGRCDVKPWFYDLVSQVDRELALRNSPITVAVMGCVVNGPGEARDADVGIACSKGGAVVFEKGDKVDTLKNIDQEKCFRELMAMIDEFDDGLPF